MENSPVAVIDLGTNTFHLLIAKPQSSHSFKALHEEKFVAMIGKGGISKGIITDEAYQRALQGLHHFKSRISDFQVNPEKVFATATSAIRNAKNGTSLIEDIERQTGIKVNIISGDEEAQLIYQGVKAALEIGNQTSLIIDIGGGSVEFIICDDKGVLWKRSFEIGAQRLLDKFMQSDPISMVSVKKLQEYLQEQLIPLTNAVHQYAPEVLIGASGAFDTLVDIYYNKKNITTPVAATEFELPVEVFEEIYHELLTKNREQRLAIPGMLQMRVNMIVVATCLINFILHTYSLHKIRISAYALKEGLMSLKISSAGG